MRLHVAAGVKIQFYLAAKCGKAIKPRIVVLHVTVVKEGICKPASICKCFLLSCFSIISEGPKIHLDTRNVIEYYIWIIILQIIDHWVFVNLCEYVCGRNSNPQTRYTEISAVKRQNEASWSREWVWLNSIFNRKSIQQAILFR